MDDLVTTAMNICPRCGGTGFWHLSTGQSRCKRCGLTRKLRQPLWEFTRIVPWWRERLLEYFCLGIPAHRLRSLVPLNPKSIQRWYRLMREVIYRHQMEEFPTQSMGILPRWLGVVGSRLEEPATSLFGSHVLLGLYRIEGKVFACPLHHPGDEVLFESIAPDSEWKDLHHGKEEYAYAFLEIRGRYVVFKKPEQKAVAQACTDGIEGFWWQAKQFFSRYHVIPVSCFHLYLKDFEWRYNHRTENLVALLRNLLHLHTIDDLKAPAGLRSRREPVCAGL